MDVTGIEEPSDEELRSRVTLLDDGLLLYRETPVQTPRTIAVMFAQTRILARQRPAVRMVLDLRGVERPGPTARRHLREEFQAFAPRVAHLAIVMDPVNPVLRAMAKVFAHTLGYRSVSFHDQMEEALVHAHHAGHPD
jgi:hypothetical protein